MPLSADDIRAAFAALSGELAKAQKQEQAEFVVVGGAALVLLYGARKTTKDVDALHGTFEEVRAQIEPLVLPNQRDKASYAFEDLWESVHGSA